MCYCLLSKYCFKFGLFCADFTRAYLFPHQGCPFGGSAMVPSNASRCSPPIRRRGIYPVTEYMISVTKRIGEFQVVTAKEGRCSPSRKQRGDYARQQLRPKTTLLTGWHFTCGSNALVLSVAAVRSLLTRHSSLVALKVFPARVSFAAGASDAATRLR